MLYRIIMISLFLFWLCVDFKVILMEDPVYNMGYSITFLTMLIGSFYVIGNNHLIKICKNLESLDKKEKTVEEEINNIFSLVMLVIIFLLFTFSLFVNEINFFSILLFLMIIIRIYSKYLLYFKSIALLVNKKKELTSIDEVNEEKK